MDVNEQDLVVEESQIPSGSQAVAKSGFGSFGKMPSINVKVPTGAEMQKMAQEQAEKLLTDK